MKVFIDSKFRCHTDNMYGDFAEVEDDFFDGKCDALINGYCAEPEEDGTVRKLYPWKPATELLAAQAQYEADMAEAASAYQEGVDSVWI